MAWKAAAISRTSEPELDCDHSTRWKNMFSSASRCWSACRMLPPCSKIQPDTLATNPGRSGPCSRATTKGPSHFPHAAPARDFSAAFVFDVDFDDFLKAGFGLEAEGLGL